MRRTSVIVSLSLAWTLAFHAATHAAEIGYLEEFALARDRTAALKQLIPGSEEHYYYTSLHLQQLQQFDQVDQLLKQWVARHGRTQRVLEIQLRQALLTYDRSPEQSLEFIRHHLNLHFPHQREVLGQKPDLPSELNSQLLQRERLTQQALAQFTNLDGFEDAALDWLVRLQLDPDRRRMLLQRLVRPDYPELPQLIVDDLEYKDSPGFGAYTIHRNLLLSQLDECLRLKPDLLNQQNFVQIYLTKLQPSADSNWVWDPGEKDAYLNRLWAFVQRLAPVHNSLKAHVLYHRLQHDRTQGLYDKQRFMTYIRLPRNAVYISPEFMRRDENRRFAVDLKADFQAFTLFPPIVNDEPLVRDYLSHYFVEETSIEPYEPYLSDAYLKVLLAETKILNGLGDPEHWYTLLPPAKYQQLRERIDLDFVPTNETQFDRDQPVAVDLFVKNVRTLIVKVFEINARNFYQQHLQEISTDINLDGLVANDEQTYEYNESPLRRVRRHFEFPSLTRPGIFVIDFIGNGMSSRVVVRKGQLRHVVQTTPAGHHFTILNEQDEIVPGASLWMAGHDYRADADGHIVVPFTDQPGMRDIVLTHGNLSSLAKFHHESESYSLAAGIYVDREALLARRTAEVLVRAGLYLNGIPITLQVLEDVKLTITSVDLDGVSTTKEVSPFKLFEDREASYEFQTPPRLATISFTLSAKVKNLSQNKKADLSASQSYTVNSIDQTDKVEDLHLASTPHGYVVTLLGKTGEAKPDRVIQLVLKHRDFREPIRVNLKTDPHGRVALGSLDEVVSVNAKGPEGTEHTWPLMRDQHSYQRSLHSRASDPIEIPFVQHAQPEPAKENEKKADQRPSRSHVSLLEMRGDTFVADRFDHLTVENGMLIARELPPGDYNLWLKEIDRHVQLRIAEGEKRADYVLGQVRHLEVRGDDPLAIADAQLDKEYLRIRLASVNPFVRVHLFATRYQAVHRPFEQFSRVVDAEPYVITIGHAFSQYVSGRNIGDEYRYIIDRKSAAKYPGVMVERPSLILNPWSVRTTQTGQQQAQAGDHFDRAAAPRPAAAARDPAAAAEGAIAPHAELTSNLDFLGEASVVVSNLVPNDQGLIEVPLAKLGAHQHVHIVAVDAVSTAYRSVTVPAGQMAFRDLRLTKGLDPDRHYTQQKRITVVESGESFELADIVTSKFEPYDSLARVYSLYATLNPGPHLAEFSWIVSWPKLSPTEKQEKYSKYACHELNFFLSRKDPAFFNSVIKPYLANKKDRTFLDRWLLTESLDVYLEPWRYEQLNVAERLLLAQRVAADQENGKRHVLDAFALLPTDVERFNFLFRTAIRGSSLETSDELRLGEKQLELDTSGMLGGRMKAFGAMGGAIAAPQSGPVPADEPAGRKDLSKKAAAGYAVPQLELSDQVMLEAESRQLSLSEERAESLSLSRRLGREAGANRFAYDADARDKVRQLFEKLDKTQEWAENNYYKLPIEQQNAELITVNAFWRDLAQHDPRTPFISTRFADASQNFSEMMLALALLDLPFEAGKHESKFDQASMTLKAASPVIVFHEEIREATERADQSPILVSQNFFNTHDRFRYEENERLDKFVTDEFLIHTVYGCQTVITNPTSSPQKLDVLVQIPVGAVVVSGGEATRSHHIQLQPFSTQTIEYFFYFPQAGKYPHYPVHVAKNEKLVTFAEPATFNVVEQLSRIDRESWEYISQFGTDEQVLDYLRTANLQRIDLEKIAFRMHDPKFFATATKLLAERHAYHHTLWSYSIKHNVAPAVNEFLKHANEFVAQTGNWLESPLLEIDPVVRKTYQHLEYLPLVNARAHQLGRRRQIVNDRLYGQYHQLMKVLSYKRDLNDEDRLAVTYYLLLQDRIDQAAEFFGNVNPERLATRLQYDYFATYLHLCREELEEANQIAARYAEYPVERWRESFALVRKQISEVKGASTEVLDPENRTQVQTKLAATEPSFDFQVEAKKITVNYQNLQRVTVNYYLMDIELLFSRNPFVQTHGSHFSHIRANLSQEVELPKGQATFTMDLPARLRNSNVLVEIRGAGQTKSQPYYANSLAVRITENYAQLSVVTANPGKPLSKVYVKVYARMKDGTVRFYKDGYTDIRGRFDYGSLSTNELDHVEKFALLILSDEHGAVVREVNPPLQ